MEKVGKSNCLFQHLSTTSLHVLNTPQVRSTFRCFPSSGGGSAEIPELQGKWPRFQQRLPASRYGEHWWTVKLWSIVYVLSKGELRKLSLHMPPHWTPKWNLYSSFNNRSTNMNLVFSGFEALIWHILTIVFNSSDVLFIKSKSLEAESLCSGPLHEGSLAGKKSKTGIFPRFKVFNGVYHLQIVHKQLDSLDIPWILCWLKNGNKKVTLGIRTCHDMPYTQHAPAHMSLMFSCP